MSELSKFTNLVVTAHSLLSSPTMDGKFVPDALDALARAKRMIPSIVPDEARIRREAFEIAAQMMHLAAKKYADRNRAALDKEAPFATAMYNLLVGIEREIIALAEESPDA